MKQNKKIVLILLTLGVAFNLNAAETATVSEEMFTVNNVWMLLSTFLVFIMHLGFSTLEVGLTQAKNTVNILFKNIIVVAIGILSYAIIGFSLMYPGEAWQIGKVIGFSGFGLSCPEGAAGLIDYAQGNYTYWTDFLFQGMFAATAATIVSGAVAERIRLDSFLIFSAIYLSFVYPIIGSWGWGGGWLKELGFYDFAGSTFVHSVGGWAALVGILLVGPRKGKYNGKTVRAIMGHNMPLATIGMFLLWFGWFGFNGGSVLSADAASISYVCVTTTLAAVSGIMTSMITSWVIQKKPDLSMILNGCLAGLVAVTASADIISINGSIIVGAIAGLIVVLSVMGFDKLRLDDPVGALSVHLVCGIWGTLAVGLFTSKALYPQVIGIITISTFALLSSFLIFIVIKKTIGLRVSESEEVCGLDIGEHGMEAYSGFQIFSSQ